MIFGEKLSIDSTRLGNKKSFAQRLQSFHPRGDSDFRNNEVQIRDFIRGVSKNLRLGICDSFEEPRHQDPIYPACDGTTISPWEDENDIARIYLARQTIRPLLQRDIRGDKRLALEFHVAVVLLHEFCVCIHFMLLVLC